LVVGVYPQTFVQRKPGTTETIPGLNVGKSVIQQVISTLEDWPVNNHRFYKHVPEAQIRLRDDNRICMLESAAKHNEPNRADSAQILRETYEGNGTTPRAFRTYLQTKGGAGMEEVMIASN
jgi:hypothetical protein